MDILDIISKSLLHPLDATAQAQLDHWLAESEEHQQLYQSLLASDDLAEQYHRTAEARSYMTALAVFTAATRRFRILLSS